jgi:hypothetical protein
VRALVDMEYVSSDELSNLIRLGIVLEVHFTYRVQLVQHITILLNVQRTLDDVYDSWTMVVRGDWHAGGKIGHSCH